MASQLNHKPPNSISSKKEKAYLSLVLCHERQHFLHEIRESLKHKSIINNPNRQHFKPFKGSSRSSHEKEKGKRENSPPRRLLHQGHIILYHTMPFSSRLITLMQQEMKLEKQQLAHTSKTNKILHVI